MQIKELLISFVAAPEEIASVSVQVTAYTEASSLPWAPPPIHQYMSPPLYEQAVQPNLNTAATSSHIYHVCPTFHGVYSPGTCSHCPIEYPQELPVHYPFRTVPYDMSYEGSSHYSNQERLI